MKYDKAQHPKIKSIQLLDLFTTKPSFNNFIPLGNESITHALQYSSNQFMHITGAACSGKTHLLHAAVNIKTAAIFIEGQQITSCLSSITDSYNYIAIDNIDRLCNEQQINLFNLFNKIKLNNLTNYLLTSSSITLETASIIREDLKTRLLSGMNLHLKALNDAELYQALTIFTNQEGITLGKVEQNYLINHYTRNIGVLIKAVQHLADTALLHNRNITIPLIKEVLF